MEHYSSLKSLSTKSAFIYVFWPRQQLHLGIFMHFVIHNCQVKFNQTWKTLKFIFTYIKWNDLLMLTNIKKLFKVWAISKTEHTPESFIPVKRILCKAATTSYSMVLAKQQFLYIVQLFCEQIMNCLMKAPHRYKNCS